MPSEFVDRPMPVRLAPLARKHARGEPYGCPVRCTAPEATEGRARVNSFYVFLDGLDYTIWAALQESSDPWRYVVGYQALVHRRRRMPKESMTLGAMQALADMLENHDSTVDVPGLVESVLASAIVQQVLSTLSGPIRLRLTKAEVFQGLSDADDQSWDIDAQLTFAILGTSLLLVLTDSRVVVGKRSRFIYADGVTIANGDCVMDDPIPVAADWLDVADDIFDAVDPSPELMDKMWHDIQVDEDDDCSLQQKLLLKHPVSLWQQSVAEGLTIDGYMEWVLRRELKLPLTTPEEIDS